MSSPKYEPKYHYDKDIKSTHAADYVPWKANRTQSLRPQKTTHASGGKFDGATTSKETYVPYEGHRPSSPFIP
eukprot:CAMPEP_0175140514 /NCGR_PEP_ID=MMETSP0087-20121206/11559_1 /TAXON_ID=136419 /ORGANISM="Unknown Unknown, Strain D1" /LENGTH=72 /DNA_ID=CAMNT_0016423761 /DNA_START=73 /DNA_END=288 /DNA_ORIENTATION=+